MTILTREQFMEEWDTAMQDESCIHALYDEVERLRGAP